MTTESARATFDRAIANELASGGVLESQAGNSAVFVRGKPVNHILHLILSVLTAGLWLFVWAFMVITNKKQRIVLSLNASGEISRTVTTG